MLSHLPTPECCLCNHVHGRLCQRRSLVRGRRIHTVFSCLQWRQEPSGPCWFTVLEMLILMRLELSHTTGFLAVGMTRSWGLACSLARGLPFKASPIPRSQQHPQDRDDRECAATFSELAHVPPTHSMSHSMSNGSIPHSPTHSFPYIGTQQALSEHLVCIRPYFGYHGRCNYQISDMTSGGSQSSEDMKDKQTAEPQRGK